MITIFNGQKRGFEGAEGAQWLKLEFEFRKHLRHFKGAKLAVFMSIALHADENGFCYPSYKVLKEETGYSHDAIARAIKELCNTEIDGQKILVKWKERQAGGKFGGNNRYIIFPTQTEIETNSKISPKS